MNGISTNSVIITAVHTRGRGGGGKGIISSPGGSGGHTEGRWGLGEVGSEGGGPGGGIRREEGHG